MSGGKFTFEMEHLEGYEFKVKFDAESMPDLVMDEPPPLGGRNGPNASRMLAAAVANCLSASLMFCVSKTEVSPNSMRTSVTGRIERNEKGRLRVEGFDVRITVSD
ncbi:MAG: OsmC family peroxiredoxin, partial [Gammaproteobacteria bacterium]|nr:OsmC family peroxiredoxin [Gammaproteobacteria bacterium]